MSENAPNGAPEKPASADGATGAPEKLPPRKASRPVALGENPIALRAAASAARRQRIAERVASRRRETLRVVLLVLAVAIVVAMLADCHGMMGRIRKSQQPGGGMLVRGDAKSIRDNMGHLAVYHDPSGLFSIGVPPGWRKLKQGPDSIFQASFRGPYDIEMRIQCVVTNGLTFDKLVGRLRQVERAMAADSHIGVTKLNDWHVVTRHTQLWRTKTLYLDFVTGDLAHHLQFVVPTALYDEYAPVFLDLVRETYKPGQIVQLGEPDRAEN